MVNRKGYNLSLEDFGNLTPFQFDVLVKQANYLEEVSLYYDGKIKTKPRLPNSSIDLNIKDGVAVVGGGDIIKVT